MGTFSFFTMVAKLSRICAISFIKNLCAFWYSKHWETLVRSKGYTIKSSKRSRSHCRFTFYIKRCIQKNDKNHEEFTQKDMISKYWKLVCGVILIFTTVYLEESELALKLGVYDEFVLFPCQKTHAGFFCLTFRPLPRPPDKLLNSVTSAFIRVIFY